MDVGLPDATLENWAESPLYGELYPITKPAYNLSQAVQYNHNDTNVDKNDLLGPYYNIHKNILTMNPTISISSKSSNIYSYTTHIKILEF